MRLVLVRGREEKTAEAPSRSEWGKHARLSSAPFVAVQPPTTAYPFRTSCFHPRRRFGKLLRRTCGNWVVRHNLAHAFSIFRF